MRTFSKPIHERNIIHPTAIIDDGVEIGQGNYIGPYCIIRNGTTIGDNNRLEAFVTINTPGEHRDYMINPTGRGVEIGNNNIFREYTTINGGTTHKTIIGNDNTMLRGSHFSHDSIMENNITLSCNVAIGGHSHLMEGCNMALNSVCHQYSVIGSFSMVGMGGVVTKTSIIKPGEIHVGNPVKLLKSNKIGLERAGIDGEKLSNEVLRYFNLCNKEI